MGEALLAYLQLKVHSLIQGEEEWARIFVVGEYDRRAEISTLEKSKLFNWQRPTADVVGGDLIIKCYPGHDYVLHYALIIATFLDMGGRFHNQVFYRLPKTEACRREVSMVMLNLAAYDTVIIGYGLEYFVGSESWAQGHGCAWKQGVGRAKGILYLGFFHSIWGDIGGHLITHLATLGARRIVYVGKVGSLSPSIEPNTLLATGNESILHGKPVRWLNFFDDEVYCRPGIISGVHVTSSSTLLETYPWLEKHRAYAFVDPEIGHMGKAARESGIQFGYLHIISNNLAHFHQENLSNERISIVIQKRQQLLTYAHNIVVDCVEETET